MSDKLNTYSFLPWVREGISNQIGDNDGSNDKLRATIDIEFKVKGDSLADGEIKSDAIQKTVSLYGPGDVIGIDNKTIIKTEPLNWITNFEPNYLPCIDFYDEDFPWRYSPATPDAQSRLLPWLALVVLEEGMFIDGKDITGKPLPYFSLKEGILASDVFQSADQLWAWAHVHVNSDLIKLDAEAAGELVSSLGPPPITSFIEEYKRVLDDNPDNAYSRIICPIKLKENAAYHAFLIPAFESGRLAGLGMDVESIFNADDSPYTPTAMAWALTGETDGRVEKEKFPIYHRWYFRTGNVGDFEYLVRLLEPKPVDSRVGTRNMDVTEPGSGVDGISDEEIDEDNNPYPELGGVLRLGGALKIPDIAIENKEEYEKYENWDQPYPRAFQKQVAAFINLADDYSKKDTRESHGNDNLPERIKNIVPLSADKPDPDPLITPPLYGCWHSLSKRLLMDNNRNPDDNWVHKINLDPRHRTTAGFGTKIVQKNQEKYMEAAWKQVGDVLEANRQIRQAQFAQFAAKKWFNSYMEPLRIINQGAYLGLTQPVHSRVISEVPVGDGNAELFTVNHQVKTSKVPGIIFSPSIRKYSRPGGRISKSLKFDPKTNPVERLAERINKDEVIPALPKKIPGGVNTIQGISEAHKPKKAPRFILHWIEKYRWMKYIVLGASLVLIALLVIFVGPDLSNITPGFGSLAGFGLLLTILLLYLFYLLFRWEKQLEYAPILEEENQSKQVIVDFPKKPGFKITVAGEDTRFQTGESDSDEGKRFRTALIDAAGLLQANIEASEEVVLQPLLMDQIAIATSEKLNPQTSIPDYILKTRVRIPDRIRKERNPEVFKEAMAYPELDTPMFKPLTDISAELFLPNINYVSQNSISLLETNQPFIEAYMVGLNHEFARELLWREYPTDQRGSYFRQFWDVSDFTYDPEDLNMLRDLAISDLDENATEDEIKAKTEELIRESLKDIPPLHSWRRMPTDDDAEAHFLGKHDHREKYKKEKLADISYESVVSPEKDHNELVLVIRGEFLKKYPNAVIYAHKAMWQGTDDDKNAPDMGKERAFVPPPDDQGNPPRNIVKTPLYEAKVDPDIYFFGFDLTAEVALGLTEGEPENLNDRAGWFFVIKERPGEPRFGLDVGSTEEDKIEVWNDMTWGNLSPAVDPETPGENYIKIDSQLIDISSNDVSPENQYEKEEQHNEDISIKWHPDMNSSELAYILFQAPVMMAVHAVEMLPETD